jgi:hypothetical protein
MEYHGHAYVICDNDDDLMASMRGGSISDSVKRKSISSVCDNQVISIGGIHEKEVPSIHSPVYGNNMIFLNQMISIGGIHEKEVPSKQNHMYR